MIRKATLNDQEEIYRLGELINSNFSKLYNLEDMFEEEFNKIYVVMEDKKIVGFLMALVLYESCEILNIVIDEPYRNKKYASSLVDTMISELPESVSVITLEVAVDNKPAISLYQKFGLKIINTRKNYYGNKDAYLMGVKYERD